MTVMTPPKPSASDNPHQLNSVLHSRYASPEMAAIFADETKYGLWRQLWIALAKAQQKLGLPITDQQIDDMCAHISPIDFNRVAELEAETHHDVMAHLLAWGEQCPSAKPIIHLGATSCYVTDNGDLIQQRQALGLLISKTQLVCQSLTAFCDRYADFPCVAYTHFQPAQPTTVGKRAALWLQDFVTDLGELKRLHRTLHFLGAKGATGTQASFLHLFEGDADKVNQLDAAIAQEFQFDHVFSVTGQTYPRKQDVLLCDSVAGIACSAHKFAQDLRLLAHMGELLEPFGKKQVGSSAMPHKRNPILSERICGLARHLVSLSMNPKYTAALQMMERSLDDSANRRLTLPDLFITADAILDLVLRVCDGMEVQESRIRYNYQEAVPALALEPLLMLAVEAAGDRQEAHEALRSHFHAAAQDPSVTVASRIANDPDLSITADQISQVLGSEALTGRSADQVRRYLKEVKSLLDSAQ